MNNTLIILVVVIALGDLAGPAQKPFRLQHPVDLHLGADAVGIELAKCPPG